MARTVLLTGASGMLGSRAALALCERGHRVVGLDRSPAAIDHAGYTHVRCDLTRPDAVEAAFAAHAADRVIHLAALAHVTGETDLSWSRYFRLNVLVSQTVFDCAARRGLPVFFASTVDVYGIRRGTIDEDTPPAPLGGYARSKLLAERRLAAAMGDTPFMIARFAPVYTEEDRHDIRKRYYVKYPSLAFVVGKGLDYFCLDVNRAVAAMARWVESDPAPRGVVNVFDDRPFNSADMVREDLREGRARRALRLPGWVGGLGLLAARLCPARLRLNVNKVLRPPRYDGARRDAFLASGADGAPHRLPPPDLRGVRVLLLEAFARQSMAMMPALKKLGCHVTTYNVSRLDLGYASRWPDVRLIAPWDREDPEASFEALMAVLRRGRYDVTIPLTDFSAQLLTDHLEAVSALTHPAANPPERYYRAVDKAAAMRACAEAGVPCPRTLEDIGGAAVGELGFPLVVKPRLGYGAIGFGVVGDAAALERTLAAAAPRHGPMVVQEYIPQTGKQYQCQAFIDADGAPRSCVVFDKTRWYPVSGGSSCCNTTVRRPDIAADVLRLLRAVDWRGYADVDLIEDPRDGVAKVLEINPRVTGGVKICFAAGVDPARQIVELALGLPVTEYPDYREGVRLRYMHTDLLWLLKSPNRFRAEPGWFDFRHTTDMIFSPKDPWPFVTYSLQAIGKLRRETARRQ